MATSFEIALGQWREGERRMAGAPLEHRAQRGHDRGDVAEAAELADEATARPERAPDAGDHLGRPQHPVQRRIGEHGIEPAVEGQRVARHHPRIEAEAARRRHLLGGQPGAAGGGYTVEQHIQVLFGVRVGVETDGDAQFSGAAGMDIVQVEAGGMSVDLHRHAVTSGRREDLLHVQPVRLAFQQEAAGRVAEHVDVRLAGGEHELMFEVSDDGHGFDPRATPPGTGLQGMADRLDAIGKLKRKYGDGEAAILAGNGPQTLAERERQAILDTLQDTSGKLAETARRLGISRTTLWRRLKTYGLEGLRPTR